MKKPHVRLYSEDRDSQLLVVLDQRSSMFFGSAYKTKSVIGAELAASLLWQCLANNDRSQLLLISDSGIQNLGLARSQNSVMRSLQSIAETNQGLTSIIGPVVQQISLHDVVDRANQICDRNGGGNQVVMISDMRGLDNAAQKGLQHLSHKNELSVVRVSDPLEGKLGAWTNQVFSNSSQQFEITTANKALAAEFGEHALAKREKLSQLMEQLGRPLIFFDTLSDVPDQIIAKGASNG